MPSIDTRFHPDEIAVLEQLSGTTQPRETTLIQLVDEQLNVFHQQSFTWWQTFRNRWSSLRRLRHDAQTQAAIEHSTVLSPDYPAEMVPDLRRYAFTYGLTLVGAPRHAAASQLIQRGLATSVPCGFDSQTFLQERV